MTNEIALDPDALLRDMISEAIVALYDDPSGMTSEELDCLRFSYRKLAHDHGVDFDKVVAGCTEYERERMARLLDGRDMAALPVATTKVVYNACFGGFSVSEAAMKRYAELKGVQLYIEKDAIVKTYWTVPPADRIRMNINKIYSNFNKRSDEQRRWANAEHAKLTLSARSFSRTDPLLVQVVEELGDKANGRFAQLAIKAIPKGMKYRIDEYDGNETVMTIEDYEWETA